MAFWHSTSCSRPLNMINVRMEGGGRRGTVYAAREVEKARGRRRASDERNKNDKEKTVQAVN